MHNPLHTGYGNGKLSKQFPIFFFPYFARTFQQVFRILIRYTSNCCSRIIEQAVFKGIDDLGIPTTITLWDIRPIIPLNMAVDKILWLPSVNKLGEAGKASVRQRIKVIDMPGRCVGQQDVEAMMPADFQP